MKTNIYIHKTRYTYADMYISIKYKYIFDVEKRKVANLDKISEKKHKQKKKKIMQIAIEFDKLKR